MASVAFDVGLKVASVYTSRRHSIVAGRAGSRGDARMIESRGYPGNRRVAQVAL